MSFEKTKKINILGVTGSVGQCAADVILSAPDCFDVQAVTAGSNAKALAENAIKLKAKTAIIAQESSYDHLKQLLSGTGIEVKCGEQEIVQSCARADLDLVLAATVGFSGLAPILKALEHGVNVAVANKEPLVAAGELVMRSAAKSKAKILPVDSEHNAVFQVFEQRNRDQIDKIILTASGGPFRTVSKEEMDNASVAKALAHPNWSMGRKISIDSASMMNKALEVIEAHYLFDMPPEKIDVLVHPQSVVHSMVSYVDGSILAQMGASDMRTPVAYALAWPERMESPGAKLDFSKMKDLSFEQPDHQKFPALNFAYECLRRGQSACVVFNAANEVAVEAFLQEKIKFGQIVNTVEAMLAYFNGQNVQKSLKTLEEIQDLDKTVRRKTAESF